METYKQNLSEFFDESQFNLSIDEGDTISITPQSCGKIRIDSIKKKIKILILNKCNISGTIFLNKINAFANKYEMDIELLDASEIELEDISIKLSILNILSTGESWYNKYGYYSENYADEIVHNRAFIAQPASVLYDIIKKQGDPFQSTFTNQFGYLVEEDDTIQNFFIEIKKQLSSFNIQQLKWVKRFITWIY